MTKVTVTKITATVTCGIKAMIDQNPAFAEFVSKSVHRHTNHDWGDTYDEDKVLNDADPESAMSTYRFTDDVKIWVKSEDGHIIVLFPSEY